MNGGWTCGGFRIITHVSQSRGRISAEHSDSHHFCSTMMKGIPNAPATNLQRVTQPPASSTPLYAPESKRRALPSAQIGRRYVIIGAVLLVLGCGLGVMAAVDPGGLDAGDLPLNTLMREPAEQVPALAETLRMVAEVGAPVVASIVGTVFGALLVVLKRPGWMAYFAVVAIGSVIITEVAKRVVQRQRPQWPDPLAVETSFSFPSGHTTSGITMWATMGLVVLFAFDRTRWRTILGWVFVVAGVGMGISRLLLGVHWVTDVMGGWLFGFGWFFLISGVAVLGVNRRSASLGAAGSASPGAAGSDQPSGPAARDRPPSVS
jgi:membrane-associated phospholipid phosphatase